MLQAYASEPQRAESPPTPAVPPVSYFLNKEPVVTSYITPLPQPVPMPGAPVQAPMQQAYPQQGKHILSVCYPILSAWFAVVW